MPDIFEHLDYREYLKECFKKLKATKSFFSYRFVSQKTGIDPGQLTKIIQSQLHLSEKNINKIISFLELNPREGEYFEILVNFGKAKTAQQTETYFQKLLSFREVNPTEINGKQLQFYTHWYHVAIYAYISIYPKIIDFKTLGKKLVPDIDELKAKESIQLLKDLKLIEEDQTLGTWIITEKHISTPEKWTDSIIKSFQKTTLDLAKDSLDSIPKQHRHFTTLTVSISPKYVEQLKAMTEEYRRNVIKLVEECDNPSVVMQLNTQLFPVSKWEVPDDK